MRKDPSKFTLEQNRAMISKMRSNPELFNIDDRLWLMPHTVSDSGGELPADDKAIMDAVLAMDNSDPTMVEKIKLAKKAGRDALNRGADYGEVQAYLLKLGEKQAQSYRRYQTGTALKPDAKAMDLRSLELQYQPRRFEPETKTYRNYDPSNPAEFKQKFQDSIQGASFPVMDEPAMTRTYENQPPTANDRFNYEQRIKESQAEQDRQLKYDQMMNEQLYKYLEENKDKTT